MIQIDNKLLDFYNKNPDAKISEYLDFINDYNNKINNEHYDFDKFMKKFYGKYFLIKYNKEISERKYILQADKFQLYEYYILQFPEDNKFFIESGYYISSYHIFYNKNYDIFSNPPEQYCFNIEKKKSLFNRSIFMKLKNPDYINDNNIDIIEINKEIYNKVEDLFHKNISEYTKFLNNIYYGSNKRNY